MKLFKNIKSVICLLIKKYPSGWVGDEFIKRYYKSHSINTIKEGVIFMCDGRKYHGGLTDRLQGILTTYYIAKKHNLSFYINWVEPFSLSDYLLPNTNKDWRISPDEIIYDARFAFPAIMSLQPKSEKKKNKINELFFKSWFFYPKKQTHVYTNLNFANRLFPKLYKELFVPSDNLAIALKKHQDVLGEKYWSFSFRFNQLLGDFKDTIGTPLPKNEAEELIRRNIKELTELLSELPQDYKAFIACDSKSFLERVKDIDPRIYYIPGEIVHIDQMNSDDKVDDIWMKTFVDQHLIMNAIRVFLLQTGNMYDSGFPRFAALIGGKEFINHKF